MGSGMDQGQVFDVGRGWWLIINNAAISGIALQTGAAFAISGLIPPLPSQLDAAFAFSGLILPLPSLA